MMQSEYMGKQAAITVRVPPALRRRLEAKATRERRSLSAQVEHELTQSLASEGRGQPAKAGSFLGRYEGGPVPTDAEFREVRERLWGRLAAKEDESG
jgi:hypothetical protein